MKGQIIKGLDIIDTTKCIDKDNRKYQAMILKELEELIDDREVFLKVRKLILDKFNDYTRSILKAIFGTDFEGLIR